MAWSFLEMRNSAFNIQQIGKHLVEREKHFHIYLNCSRTTALLKVEVLQKIRVFVKA